MGRHRRLRCTSDHPVFDPGSASLRPAGDWAAGHLTEVLVLENDAMGPRPVDAAADYVGVFEVFELTLNGPGDTLVAESVLVGSRTPG